MTIVTEYDNELLAKINEHLLHYTNSTSAEVKSELLAVIADDLKEFQDGISFNMIEAASP